MKPIRTVRELHSIKMIATINDQLLKQDDFEKIRWTCLNYAKKIQNQTGLQEARAIVAEDWVGPETDAASKQTHPLRSIAEIIKTVMVDHGLITPTDGYEYWLNINKKQGFHYDCDEGLRQKHGVIRLPLVSTVFYISCPDQQEAKTGSLILHQQTEDIAEIHKLYTQQSVELSSEYQRVSPKENRLVYFPPRVPHKVEQWDRGERISLAVNFWKHRPLESNHTDLQLLRTLLRIQVTNNP